MRAAEALQARQQRATIANALERATIAAAARTLKSIYTQ